MTNLGLLFISFSDLIMTPLYIYIFYRIVKWIRNTHYLNSEKGDILIRAFWIKVIGSIAISCVYEFYYQGGDIESYFGGANSFFTTFFGRQEFFWKLLFIKGENIMKENASTAEGQAFFMLINSQKFLNTPEFTTIKVSGLVSIFTLHSYTTNGLFFAMFSFFGSWKLFNLLCELYPQLIKKFAIACFYIPSIVFWGSGLLKDPLTYGGLCLIVHYTYELLVKHKYSIGKILLLLLNIYLVLQIKPYIFLCVLPGLMLLILFSNIKRLNLPILKILLLPFLIVLFALFTYLMADALKEQLGKYSLESLTGTMQAFQTWHTAEAEISGGAAYSLGDMDYSTFGILKKLPLAVNVTFFRPYIWETKKPIILLSSLESLWFLLITLRTFKRVGIRNFFSLIGTNPFLFFCFFYAIVFGFAVGISSYNFGALVRYKIPCMSFYLISIYIIDYLGYTRYQVEKTDKKLPT